MSTIRIYIQLYIYNHLIEVVIKSMHYSTRSLQTLSGMHTHTGIYGKQYMKYIAIADIEIEESCIN